MLVMREFVVRPLLSSQCDDFSTQMNDIHFYLSILVVVLLTAGGNIINDYFDVKVDKINKPEKVIIGTKVKRRVAMLLHQTLNFLAVGISIYLCYSYQFWPPLIIPLLVATLLWWYSPIFKKQVFIGNFIVAICVAIIPIWAALFEMHAIQLHYASQADEIAPLLSKIWFWIGAYAIFAFIISLAREAIKDLEDLRGDRAGLYQTMPIIQGERFTKIYASTLMLVCLALAIVGVELLNLNGPSFWLAIGLTCTFVGIPACTSIIYALRGKSKHDYTQASLFSKTTMAGGIILCIAAGSLLWTC